MIDRSFPPIDPSGSNGPTCQAEMTGAEQHRWHNGPDSAGLPGHVVFGDGDWFVGDDGEWHRKEEDR